MPGEEGSGFRRSCSTILLDSKETVVDCVENDKPFIGGYFCNAPELFNAMDLPWFMLMETPFLAASAPYLTRTSRDPRRWAWERICARRSVCPSTTSRAG